MRSPHWGLSAPLTRGGSTPDAHLGNTAPESELFDGRRAGFLRRIRTAEGVLSLFPPRHRACLRTLWLELCSFVARIGYARKNNWFRYGIAPGSLALEACLPRAIRDRRRRVHIRGIQIMLSTHPAPSPSDFHILLRAIDRLSLGEDPDRGGEYPTCSAHKT